MSPRAEAEARVAPTAEEVAFLMQSRGWVLFPGQLSRDACAELAADSDRAYEACRKVQVQNGVAGPSMEGAAHHVVGYGGALDRFLDDLPLHAEIERWFDGGKYILLTYGAAINPPAATTYTGKP
ncbi:MAG: hypothetical protein J0I28_07415, partial [Caulobacterales bacterium]|nr:hypothetical protein [Caulobacterales bacterium]